MSDHPPIRGFQRVREENGRGSGSVLYVKMRKADHTGERSAPRRWGQTDAHGQSGNAPRGQPVEEGEDELISVPEGGIIRPKTLTSLPTFANEA